MPGNMSKEDAPSRSASLTFTIDSILNLKQRDGGDFGSKAQRNSGCTKDEAERETAWGAQRRRRSGSEDAGNFYLLWLVAAKQAEK